MRGVCEEFISVHKQPTITKGGIKMRGNVKKIVMGALVALISVFVNLVTFAEALDVKLLWKKDFKYKLKRIDFATGSGDVIVVMKEKENGVGKEVILYDRGGNERFHWGPRMDRRVGWSATISKDGKYFAFTTGYTQEYAEKKKVHVGSDERVHFYDRQTKKELWNTSIGEESPIMFPDGLSMLIYGYETGIFNIYNRQGKIIFEQNQQRGEINSFKISPDGNYFAFINGTRGPLLLYKRDGTKQWEKGYHSEISSISDGASYISTFRYTLGPSSRADELNSHKGMVCDRSGNKVMEGFGVLSGSASKIAMLYPDKVSVLNWPEKALVKEIMIDMREVFETSSSSHTRFSYDGRYLFLKSGTSIKVYDLLENTNREIKIPDMGKYPDFFITEDGKYLLINPEETKTLFYYQTY